MAVTADEANAVLRAPKRVSGGTLAWDLLPSALGGHVLVAVINFVVLVEHDDVPPHLRELYVRGEMKGDKSHCIWLRTPTSNEPLVRLCSASHHEGAHWHWDGLPGVKGGRVEPTAEVELSDPASTNRDEMLANFCARLTISDMNVQGSLP